MLAVFLAAGLTIQHDPLDCMVKGQFPLVHAWVQPAAANVRLFFKAAESDDDYFFVTMTPEKDHFVARLPKPKEKPGRVSYYIEAVAEDGTGTQTPEITVAVVKDSKACPKERVAPRGEGGNVRIASTTDA